MEVPRFEMVDDDAWSPEFDIGVTWFDPIQRILHELFLNDDPRRYHFFEYNSDDREFWIEIARQLPGPHVKIMLLEDVIGNIEELSKHSFSVDDLCDYAMSGKYGLDLLRVVACSRRDPIAAISSDVVKKAGWQGLALACKLAMQKGPWMAEAVRSHMVYRCKNAKLALEILGDEPAAAPEISKS
jgi:hypothetical protein